MATPIDTRISGVWTDIFAATGFPVGSPLYIQNKSSKNMWIMETTSQPTTDSRDGIMLVPYAVASVLEGSLGCWVYGSGDLCVQNNV